MENRSLGERIFSKDFQNENALTCLDSLGGALEIPPLFPSIYNNSTLLIATAFYLVEKRLFSLEISVEKSSGKDC